MRVLVNAARQPISEALAAQRVLGLEFETLGLGVAKAWGLPVEIQRCMRKPGGEPPSRPPDAAVERLRDNTDAVMRK